MEALRVMSKDPDDQVPLWVRHGDPACVFVHPECKGICPFENSIAAGSSDPAHLSTNSQEFANYSSVDQDGLYGLCVLARLRPSRRCRNRWGLSPPVPQSMRAATELASR
eukprot:3135795-Amphidinium_carterae.2